MSSSRVCVILKYIDLINFINYFFMSEASFQLSDLPKIDSAKVQAENSVQGRNVVTAGFGIRTAPGDSTVNQTEGSPQVNDIPKPVSAPTKFEAKGLDTKVESVDSNGKSLGFKTVQEIIQDTKNISEKANYGVKIGGVVFDKDVLIDSNAFKLKLGDNQSLLNGKILDDPLYKTLLDNFNKQKVDNKELLLSNEDSDYKGNGLISYYNNPNAIQWSDLTDVKNKINQTKIKYAELNSKTDSQYEQTIKDIKFKEETDKQARITGIELLVNNNKDLISSIKSQNKQLEDATDSEVAEYALSLNGKTKESKQLTEKLSDMKWSGSAYLVNKSPDD
ncbi:MAG: hypothetical protein ACRCZ2_14065, partial [Fusobacteriaceae bacterium]